MKLLIAVALPLLAIGLSRPGFGQTINDGSGDGSVRVDRVEFHYSYENVFMNIFFNNLMENPFLSYDDYQSFDSSMSDVPCFLNQLIFKNRDTNETYQAEYTGTCNSDAVNSIRIDMNPRDYFRLVSDEFLDTTLETIPLEMYTADMLGAPFNIRIESNDTVECDLIWNRYSFVGINELDYLADEGIILLHLNTLIDVSTVDPNMLSLSRDSFRDTNNTINMTDSEVLNLSPGLTTTIAIQLTLSDREVVASKEICTRLDNQDCYLVIESGFAAAYFGEEVSPNSGYQINNIQRAPTDSDPVTVSIQLEYVGGLAVDMTLIFGQPFTVRSFIGERIISVMCMSRDTSQHVNPMLNIDNGAVSILPNYIQNDWPNSTTLNAPRGLAESGLQGYYTCRTEGDTFFSPHLLHSNVYQIFYYQGASATADVYENIVLRFAHGNFSGTFDNDRFLVQASAYDQAAFEYRFEINTPFLYHSELHINRTRFDYEGEYVISYDSFFLQPSFVINVNEPELTIYPPVLTVLSSGTPDTTASLTCTSDNTNVPVLFPGDYTSLGITSTYLDDTNSSVRLDFELNESIISMLEGTEFICAAMDPDDFNSTVSTGSSTFRRVSDSLSLFAIEPDSSREQVMDGVTVNTTSSFECLLYINPTRTDSGTIAGTLFWRINQESKDEIEFNSDMNNEEFIVTTLENSITLNILLGDFIGSVSCVHGDDSVKINVVTKALVPGVDFIPFIFPEDAVELFDNDDGCSQRIYSSTGIPFGAETHQYVHICTNGMLTVGTPPLSLLTALERFPTSDARISQSNLLAPFWNDHDGRDPTSNVGYKVYGAGDPDGFMNIVGSFVTNRVSVELDDKFKPTWMLVASWRDVPPYPHTAIDRGRNSFEAIVITDGVVTFVVYTYNCDDLQWGQSQNGDFSTIGYNINPASFFGSDEFSSFHDHQISNLPMSEMIGCSSLARGSRFHNEVYFVGRSVNSTQSARAECARIINNDTLYNDVINATTVMNECPCNLAQASRDFAYSPIDMFELTLDPMYARQFCVTPSFAQTNTILCCYRGRSGSLNNVRGISGVVAYSPSFFPREFLDNDYNLRSICSIGGETETRYRTRRPPVTCATYSPPRRTFCTGDPHLTNLDGAKFTFNGWGEYILLELETANTTFWVQARMQPIVGSLATELTAFAFAMSRDTPVEIRLINATRQLEILISGEDVTDQLVNVSSSISTDFYSVSRSSSNSILATFPNGMGLMVNLSSMLTFTVIIPDAFRGLTRGMVGNYNGNVTDDVVFRNGTMVPISELSSRILHQVGLSWQVDASESLFTYPEGLTTEDFAVLDHDPPYLDEVVANASAEVRQMCGDNVECIFDSIETGDINIGVETMTIISQIDEDEMQAANFPPMINGPDSLYVTLGEEAVLVFNVTDDKGIINVTLVDGLPARATLLPTPNGNFTVEYTFRLQLDTIVDLSLVFLATDELDAGSTLEVQIVICACENNGNCTLEGVVDQSASTVVSNCVCPQGWEGDFCEADVDGCANFDCFMGVDCVDVPAPGVGAMCGPCPQGYLGDGSKCADINECNSTHGCDHLCVNQPGSFECACFPGYELFNQTECRDVDECSLLNGGCHQICTNTIGGFNCSCDEGYTINTDNRTCQVDPVAMCDASNSCVQSCVRLSGMETCGCLPGYELASNGMNCTNINECQENPCEQICTDLEGGYECSCREGYQLLPGGRCTDINECLVAALDIFGPDLCEPSMFCVNVEGNYSCECPAGTLLVEGVCEAALVSATCGNGTIEGTDICDDNNTITGDGCDDTCQMETGYSCDGEPSICVPVCGDGLIIAPESCDDNDTMTGDGCNDICQMEIGFECSSGEPSMCYPICGDGLILGTEQCDDNSNKTGDGCDGTCQIETGYFCDGEPSNCISVCGDGIRIIEFEECDDGNLNPSDGCSETCRVILLDLNIPDNTTLSYNNEYFELNEVVFLFDPNNTNLSSFFLSEDGGNWTHLYLVVLNGVESIDVSVDIYPTEAMAAGRTPFYFARSRSIFQNDPQGRLAGLDIDATEVVAGMEFTGDDETSPDGDEQFSRQEIAAALDSIGYIAREHPDYVPREVCVIARDGLYSSTACVTLYFIGCNDDPPVISYTPNTTVQFVEGQRDFIQIVAGSLIVTDQDHPTRYLMMSARVVIMGFVSSYPEQLSVTYEHPDFNYNFDPSNGELTINGNGTADLYSQLLANITYHNNMTEPTGDTRTIGVIVSDGVHDSNEQFITVDIVNVNDAPVVSLDGSAPMATVTYTERDGESEVVRQLVVIDTDPFAMIQRATVTLTNAVDIEFESITISANLTGLGLDLDNTTSNRLEVTGVATQEVYSVILRSLTYRHDDSNPGNPTQEPARIVEFSVEDETNTTSATSLLTILITPVNDAPVLSFVSDPALRNGPLVQDGETESTFMYLEDDQPLIIGMDIYLRDVDSNISSVTIHATGLVDGLQDRLLFPSLYGITLNVTELGDGNRSIVLSGEATPQVYEQVLRTLSYQNGYTNNSVTDGRRTIAIVAEDTMGVRSGVMYIVTNIFVMDRNDGPAVDLGNGVNVDHTITFTEGGSSIPITQTFLASLTDEEGHNISRMTVELTAVNGLLDSEEALFFRTPNPLQAEFLGYIDEQLSTYIISLTVNASVSLYQEALTSIFYLNAQEEPSVYNASTGNDRLIRIIVINITDANYIDPNTDPADATDADMGVSTTTVRIGVEIDTINDNRPMILIRSDPESCSTDSRDSAEADMAGTRRRRDIRSVSRIQKKSILLNSKKDLTVVMAPKIVSAVPVFTNTTLPSTKCLQQVTVTFNTDTNAPIVEMPSVIGDIISFDPPHLDSAKKYGQWLDYQTLVVIFMGDCVEVEVETTSGKARPIFVAFMAEQGDCDWDTPCTSGVCFRNETGCPMVTYTHISMGDQTPPTAPGPAPVETTQTAGDQPQSRLMALLYNLCIAAVVLLTALLVVFTCTTACRKRTRSPATIKQVEISHPTTLKHTHVQDLPVVVTFNPSSIVTKPTTVPTQANPTKSRQQAAKKSNIRSQQEDENPLLEASSEGARIPISGQATDRATSKKRSPGKRGEKQQPKAKRKPPFPKEGEDVPKPIEVVPASNERLQDVVTSCDHSSPFSLGPSAIIQCRREQCVEHSKHHHPSQTTIVKNGTRESDQSV